MPFQDVDFLTVQIRAGLTWSRIAKVSKYEARRKRGRAQAQKAYETAVAYLGKANLKQHEAAKVNTSLASLRSKLQQLGENV